MAEESLISQRLIRRGRKRLGGGHPLNRSHADSKAAWRSDE